MRPHRFLVQLNPPFRDQNVACTGHFVANPATNFTKKREGHLAEMQKKHENTKVLHCQLTSFEALLSLEKNHRRSTAIVERGPFFLRLVSLSASLQPYNNDSRQHCVISSVFCITSEEHVPLKNFRGHGTVHFEWQKKRPRRTSLTEEQVSRPSLSLVFFRGSPWRGRGTESASAVEC